MMYNGQISIQGMLVTSDSYYFFISYSKNVFKFLFWSIQLIDARHDFIVGISTFKAVTRIMNLKTTSILRKVGVLQVQCEAKTQYFVSVTGDARSQIISCPGSHKVGEGKQPWRKWEKGFSCSYHELFLYYKIMLKHSLLHYGCYFLSV